MSNQYPATPAEPGNPWARDASPGHGYTNPILHPQQAYPEPSGNYSQPGFGVANPYQPTGIRPGPVTSYPYYTDPNVLLPEHPQATPVLVLGVISLVLFPLLGPVAWAMGSRARREIAAQPGRYRSGGTLTVGWVMGIIASSLLLLGVVFIMLALGLFVAISS
jgi:hypothetical protein